MPDNDATIYRAFREMLGWHRCRLNKVLNRYGLYSGQPMILQVLAQRSEPTQKELAEALHISSATITTSLQRMERAGLLTRTADARDTRCKRIRLTEKGRSVHAECQEAFVHLDEAMFQGFSGAEQEELKRFFLQITGNLQAYDRDQAEGGESRD